MRGLFIWLEWLYCSRFRVNWCSIGATLSVLRPRSWGNISGGADPGYTLGLHGDHHAVAFDPTDHNIVAAGNDGGVLRSNNFSAPNWHWNDISRGMIATGFYKITTQSATATTIAGGSQDNGIELPYGNISPPIAAADRWKGTDHIVGAGNMVLTHTSPAFHSCRA